MMMTILAFLVAGYAIVQYLIIGPEHAGLVQAKITESLMNLNALWYNMLTIHVISSVITIIIGPFTLSRKFREKNLKRHRILGKAYLIGILIGGGTGLYLAFYATGGIISTFGFGTLSILWLLTAYYALSSIKKRQVEVHRQWMIRNYSLTFAGVALRLWLLVFVILFGEENFETSYTIIAWLCWVPNLLFAEWWIQSTARIRLNRT
jgi:uncharacterized membrane protein